MSGIVMPRRRFVAGLIGLVAAPAVVRAASLMPVRPFCEAPRLLAITKRLPFGIGTDVMCSAVQIDTGLPWPGTMTAFISHRRDLSDLAEPYLSQVRN